jgi:cold shock CspA family protein
MLGTVNNLIVDKFFGFIIASNGQEYFFHKNDVNDNWNLLVQEYERLGKRIVQVAFEPLSTEKGPRARNVTLVPE